MMIVKFTVSAIKNSEISKTEKKKKKKKWADVGDLK